MGKRNRICVLCHEMGVQRERLEGDGARGRRGRLMKKGEYLRDCDRFVDTPLHNTLPKARQSLRFHR